METKTIGPLTKSHVPELKKMVDIYSSAEKINDLAKNGMAAGLCHAIDFRLGIFIHGDIEFGQFVGFRYGEFMCPTPHNGFDRGLSWDKIQDQCIKPRIEVLEKIINHLNN